MNEKYQIYNIAPELILDEQIEDGMLRKDWYLHPELGKCLFKESAPSQAIISEARTDWTEKVVNEIAELLNLPVARYELANGYFEESAELVHGVVSINCIPENAEILTGEEFMIQSINYDRDNPSQYTIENVLKALDRVNVKPPCNWETPIPAIDTGAKLFVGYMLLDCYVTNSDRHDHNWSVMSVGERLELVPSFDHGISLGSTDEDEDKPNLVLSDYVDRYSQSCFQEGYKKLSTLTIFNRAAQLYPEAARIWQEKLRSITNAQIDRIFDRLPEGRITPTADRFARQLLAHNREKMLEIIPERQPLRDAILQVARQLKRDACDLSQAVLDASKKTSNTIASITEGNYDSPTPTVTSLPKLNNLDELQSERAAISAILQVPQALDDMLLRGFTSECLINPQYREICVAAVEYHGEHGEVNLANIRDRLSNDTAATATAIVENTNASPCSPIDVERLIAFDRRRELVNIAERLESAAFDLSYSNDDLFRVLDESEIAIRATEDRSRSIVNEEQPQTERSPKKNSSKGR